MKSNNTIINTDNSQVYAAIYCRVSTEEQANNRISLHDQEQRCLDRAKQLGYIVKPKHIFRDEWISGTSIDKRPGMIELLSSITWSKFQKFNDINISAIISLSMDRISRNHYDYLFFKKLLEKHSVKFISIEQEYIGQNQDDMVADLLENIISIFNELLVKITAKKTSFAMERKVLDWWLPWQAPFGYMNVNIGSDEKPERVIRVNEEESKIVQEMYNKYAQWNCSYSDLTKYLKQKGFTNKNGKLFAKSSVNKILNNIFYTGKILFKNKVYDWKHAPIISQELFDKVSRLSKERDQNSFHQKKYYHYLLKGLIYCQKTGNPYSATRTFKKAKDYTKEYYFPIKTKQPEWNLDSKEYQYLIKGQYIEVEVLEKMVEEEIKKIKINSDYLDQLTEKARSMFEDQNKVNRLEESNLRKQIRDIQLQMEKLEEKYIETKTISDDVYTRLHWKYEDNKKKLETQMNNKRKIIEIQKTDFDKLLKIMKDPYTLYKNTDTTEGKTKLLKLIFEKIFVYNKKIQKVQYTSSIRDLLDNQAVLFRKTWLPIVEEVRNVFKELNWFVYIPNLNHSNF